jgi:hypothetical protein
MMALLLAITLPLQDDAAAADALAKFDAAFSKAKDSSARSSAVSGLSTPHEKVVSKLAGLLTNEDKQVRLAAARVLGGFTAAPAEVKKPASHALASGLSAGVNAKDPEVMEALFSALGGLQEESAASTIKSHWEDRDVKVAGAAVSAAGALRSKSLIEPLIELLKECERKTNPQANAPAPSAGGKSAKLPKTSKGSGSGGGTPQPDPEAAKRERAANLQSAAGQALTAITGQSHSTGEEWERWWSKNRATFTPQK